MKILNLPVQKLSIAILAVLSIGTVCGYFYFTKHLENQAISRLSSKYLWDRMEAGEYLISVKSSKAVSYWEGIIHSEINRILPDLHDLDSLEDEDIEIDPWIFSHLTQIDPDGVEVVRKLIKHSDIRVAWWVTYEVSKLGPAGEVYAPDIFNLLNLPDIKTDEYYYEKLVDKYVRVSLKSQAAFREFLNLIDGEKKSERKMILIKHLPPYFYKGTADGQFEKIKEVLNGLLVDEESLLEFLSVLDEIPLLKLPADSAVLSSTLINLLNHKNSEVAHGAIHFLNLIPKPKLKILDKEFSVKFKNLKRFLKIKTLRFYNQIGKLTKAEMDQFLNDVQYEELIKEFNYRDTNFGVVSVLVNLYMQETEESRIKFTKKLIDSGINKGVVATAFEILSNSNDSLVAKSAKKALDDFTSKKIFHGFEDNFEQDVEKGKAHIIRIRKNKLIDTDFLYYLSQVRYSFNPFQSLDIMNLLNTLDISTLGVSDLSYKEYTGWLSWKNWYNIQMINRDFQRNVNLRDFFAKIIEHGKAQENFKLEAKSALREAKSLDEPLIRNWIVLSPEKGEELEIINKYTEHKDLNLSRISSFALWWISSGRNEKNLNKVKEFLFYQHNRNTWLEYLTIPKDKVTKDQLFHNLMDLIISLNEKDPKWENKYSPRGHVKDLTELVISFGPEYSNDVRKLMHRLGDSVLQACCVSYLSEFSNDLNKDFSYFLKLLQSRSLSWQAYFSIVDAFSRHRKHSPILEELILKRLKSAYGTKLEMAIIQLQKSNLRIESLTPFFLNMLNSLDNVDRCYALKYLIGLDSYHPEVEQALIFTIKEKLLEIENENFPGDFGIRFELRDDFESVLMNLGKYTSNVRQFILTKLKSLDEWSERKELLFNYLLFINKDRHIVLQLIKKHIFKQDIYSNKGITENFLWRNPPSNELVSYFEEALSSSDEKKQLISIKSLNLIGKDAKQAIPELRKFIERNADSDLRIWAQEAINWISP